MSTGEPSESLLRSPSENEHPSIARLPSSYKPLTTFTLPSEKHYQQQYSDIYFLRLAKLKGAVEQNATEAWDELQIAGDAVRKVERVLDVRQGELCWIVGTVYMDMPLKPNILDDISKENWISAPPPREKYLSPSGMDQIMLEDESGRLRLIGGTITSELLVTGCIIAVMGTENANGDFEVIDLKLPEFPPQPPRWSRDKTASSSKSPRVVREEKGKVAIVSGLAVSSDFADNITMDLFMEYLLGEATCPTTQSGSGCITRLIIAGNSLAEAAPLIGRDEVLSSKKASKKYGYDSSAYNPAPIEYLDHFLATLLPTIPITLMPGASDPANVSIPQQPIHGALLPHSRAYSAVPGPTAEAAEPGWFDSTTNPWEGEVQGWRMLGMSGQPVDDIFKYVEADDRIEMMERMLRWRCCAPTAPDTLWCYPFQDDEPFVLSECPHVFFAGNQPRFDTAMVEGSAGQMTRLIAVPRFKETGEVVLLDLETLEVELVRFDLFDRGPPSHSHSPSTAAVG